MPLLKRPNKAQEPEASEAGQYKCKAVRPLQDVTDGLFRVETMNVQCVIVNA
jgi:hypothetical protein